MSGKWEHCHDNEVWGKVGVRDRGEDRYFRKGYCGFLDFLYLYRETLKGHKNDTDYLTGEQEKVDRWKKNFHLFTFFFTFCFLSSCKCITYLKLNKTILKTI